MAQDQHKTTIKMFEEMLEKKHNLKFEPRQLYKEESSIIGRLGGGAMRQKTWNYYIFGNNSGMVATYYRDDRYGIMF